MKPPVLTVPGYSSFSTIKVPRKRRLNEERIRMNQSIFTTPRSHLFASDLQRVISRERQSTERGLRVIKEPFPRVELLLPADSLKRNILLTVFSIFLVSLTIFSSEVLPLWKITQKSLSILFGIFCGSSTSFYWNFCFYLSFYFEGFL